MKITSVTGVTEIENIKCFKPISKIFIKIIYPENSGVASHDPKIRIRLVDGAKGSSYECVPEMSISILSEIASKYEGFQRRAATNDGDVLEGVSYHTILLGSNAPDGVMSAVDLSNDKYIDIDLKGLVAGVKYEIFGYESHRINSFIRTYRKFYLSAGELEKTFSTGDNEVLVYPIDDIKEIQLYPKSGDASPTFMREDLIIDEDSRNDLVTVAFDYRGDVRIDETIFGYSKWGVMSIDEIARFDIRRNDGLQTLTFLMIDTVPSIVSTK